MASLLAGCNGEQSMLHPAGEQAEGQALLFWVMAIGAAVIWCVVMGAAIYAVIGKRKPRSEKFADRFIFYGGVAFPTVTLAALLVFGLAYLPNWAGSEDADLRVHVTGEQYWWRFAYETADGQRVETANELHLPVGANVEFVLNSTDVIHSFWIPALGGKMDLIPGRTNLLRLRPLKAGVYRGVCAEFCGPSHAYMAFEAMVHPVADFEAWLTGQAQPADAAGSEVFVTAGCGACHRVRGVSEAGSVGPDLTHFASRRSLAAATLPLTPEALEDWLVAPSHIKPDARMPDYASLDDAQRQAIVSFLMGLK
jgi:cytochrome c oxidase subunit 2